MSLIYSGFWQLTVARIRGATRSLAGTIIFANICACIATFRRPRTAHSGLFDWVDRIFASPLTLHSLLTLLFARTLLHAHFHTPNTCPCLYRPAFVSLRIVPCIPSPRLSVSCLPARLASPCRTWTSTPPYPISICCARRSYPSLAPRARVFSRKRGGLAPAPHRSSTRFL